MYGKGYEQLLGLDRTDGVLLFRVILMIIMMVVLSDILWFTDEETKMSRLIASTPRYKSVERRKLLIGFIMAFCAWAVCLLPFIAGIRQTFGLEYICAPACSLDALSGWTGLRILDVAAAFHFGMILYCFLVSLLTKYIGRCTKNFALVSAVTFVLSAILPVIFLGQ